MTQVLWEAGEWRCELDEPNRVRLTRGAEIVTEHVVSEQDDVRTCAEIWRKAVEDVFRRPPETKA